jgi:hypothetical protein
VTVTVLPASLSGNTCPKKTTLIRQNRPRAKPDTTARDVANRKLLQHLDHRLRDVHHLVTVTLLRRNRPVTVRANTDQVVTNLTRLTSPVNAESPASATSLDDNRPTVRRAAPQIWLVTIIHSAAMEGLHSSHPMRSDMAQGPSHLAMAVIHQPCLLPKATPSNSLLREH